MVARLRAGEKLSHRFSDDVFLIQTFSFWPSVSVIPFDKSSEGPHFTPHSVPGLVPIKCREPSELCESVLNLATALGRRSHCQTSDAIPQWGSGRCVLGDQPDAGQLGGASGCRPSVAARLRREVIVLSGAESCFLNNLAISERPCCYFEAKAACSHIKSHDARARAAIPQHCSVQKRCV